MPELLLELFSEEIPARLQRRAAEDLKKAVTGALVERGLVYESAAAFVTPRRLALTVTGLPPASPDSREERKGPKTDAPQQAIEGFLRAAGLGSIAEAQVQSDPKKGDFYVALIEKKGAPAPQILAEILPGIVRKFPWGKPMRWGSGGLEWVRPLRAITATFGPEGEEPEVIAVDIDGVTAGNTTYGHRFMAPDAIRVRHFDDYVQALEKARVVLDLDRRKDIIRADAQNLAFASGLELIADEGLLEEVAGLVEWPVVMMGSFDESFLAVPEEAIIATIRANQKCFCLRDAATGRLANKFILTANLVAEDGGATITAGNERVIRARLSDAQFFYEQDLSAPLETRLPRLGSMVFHEKLGTQSDRVERLVALAREIAPLVGAAPGEAERAARLAKADLVTDMVGEFPELQGLMGRYYALAQGEAAEIATAIEEHYKPVGPSDRVPTEPVAIAVALADKLDLLTGFWSIDEKPTGSKDPYALRRAALGVIRIITENGLRLPLLPLLLISGRRMMGGLLRNQNSERNLNFSFQDLLAVPEELSKLASSSARAAELLTTTSLVAIPPQAWEIERSGDLLAFFHDRLKVSLRDAGARHDLVDAVLGASSDDLVQISRRVTALGELLAQDDGAALLAGYRRAANILSAEEKKDGRAYGGEGDIEALGGAEERALADAIATARGTVPGLIEADDYSAAIAELAKLRGPVDAFFEKVLVNDPNPSIRVQRLTLLARLRDTMHQIADFGRVAG